MCASVSLCGFRFGLNNLFLTLAGRCVDVGKREFVWLPLWIEQLFLTLAGRCVDVGKREFVWLPLWIEQLVPHASMQGGGRGHSWIFKDGVQVVHFAYDAVDEQ